MPTKNRITILISNRLIINFRIFPLLFFSFIRRPAARMGSLPRPGITVVEPTGAYMHDGPTQF